MKRFLIWVVLVAGLSGCRPLYLQTIELTGPPEYNLGWEDGCDTGISAYGAWYNIVMYGFKKRPELAANDQYKAGWNEGFTYCRFQQDRSNEGGNWGDVGLGDGF